MPRAASGEMAGCGPPVPVVWVDGGGTGPERVGATAVGTADDAVVARGCVSVGSVATGEAEIRFISCSRGKWGKGGELGRVGTSKNRSPSLTSLVCFIGEYDSVSSCKKDGYVSHRPEKMSRNMTGAYKVGMRHLVYYYSLYRWRSGKGRYEPEEMRQV